MSKATVTVTVHRYREPWELRQWRERAGLTRAEAAEQLGVDVARVVDQERVSPPLAYDRLALVYGPEVGGYDPRALPVVGDDEMIDPLTWARMMRGKR